MGSLLYSIAVLVVIIGSILLVLRFAKHALKWVLIAVGIVIIASLIFGVNIFSDIRDIQENFPKAQKLLLLKDGNTLLTGFSGKLFGSDDALSYVGKEQLAEFQQHYRQRDIQSIRGSYFKVIIFDASSFNGVGAASIGGKQIATPDVLKMIAARDTLAQAVAETITKGNLPNTPTTRNSLIKDFKSKGISTDEDMRAFLFVQLISAQKDPLFLISGFKSGTIVVYPETITFKLAKITPTNILKDMLEKMVKN